MKLLLRYAQTAILISLAACNPGQQQAARTVLDAAELACVLAPQADGTVARVCGVAERAHECADRVLDALADGGADR